MQLTYSEQDIEQHLGSPSYFQRGQRYHRGGRVRNIAWDGRTLTGFVQGRDDEPYKTTVHLDVHGRIANSECTCPMAYACKHVGALALAARVRFQDKESEPLWKEQVRSFIGERMKEQNTLQLLLRIRHITDTRLSKIAYAGQRSQNPWTLELRPRVLHTATGKYSLSTVQWSDCAYRQNKGGLATLPEVQRSFLLQLYHALGDRYGYAHGSWIAPQEEKAAYAWHLLSSHSKYGVELAAGARGEFPVHIQQELLQPTLDLAEDGNFLVLRPTVMREETRVEGPVLLIGRPPAFGVTFRGAEQWQPGPLALFPVESRGDAFTHVVHGDPIRIPKKEADVFLREFAPRIHRADGLREFVAPGDSIAPACFRFWISARQPTVS
jgi:hypothetical protein